MNSETKTLFDRALYYTYAALKDMQYQASMESLDGFNMNTNGTPCFESDEELAKYLSEMEGFVKELKEMVNEKV